MLLACEVGSVTLNVGTTATEAEEDRLSSIDIPIGDIAYFYATCSVDANPEELGINWEFDLDGDGSYDDYSTSTLYDSGDEYLHVSFDYGSYYQADHYHDVKVQACLDDQTDNWIALLETEYCEVDVVKVDRIQYNDPDTGYTDISGTLYVHKGTTVTFKALTDPNASVWPSGKPVWGGTAGASGTGSIEYVTFNTLSSSTSDTKTVTARCGDTETVNVVVYEFDGTFQPGDDFDDRNLEKWGLEEEVALEFTTTPTGITASQAGGLEWTWTGAGDLTNTGTDGTADYDAEHLQGGVTFRLEVVAGASAGKSESYWHDVVKPTGTSMTRVNPDTVWHIQGVASAGIKLYYWLDPTDVSFSNLTFGEDSCPATGKTGFFITVPPGDHAQNTLGAILGGDSTTGCRVSLADLAGFACTPPWATGGTYTWSIPTQYIDDTTTRHTFGSNQNQVPTLQANGDATIAKGGQSGSALLNDETSDF